MYCSVAYIETGLLSPNNCTGLQWQCASVKRTFFIKRHSVEKMAPVAKNFGSYNFGQCIVNVNGSLV